MYLHGGVDGIWGVSKPEEMNDFELAVLLIIIAGALLFVFFPQSHHDDRRKK